ncbi:alanine dehydrogenase [Metallumcola ferriviriculae]|uniref:Alanine dehydrogenase n=1 Tax=Metallumcola ferriviriculae TaxID=3039180 RepID=A0AAU0URA2_9FIRM|nr:alanine dehydrogenase [Desulfitibacteraceae bacterium MK1]
MIIGIPKEIKNNENRVAITPAGVAAFTQQGHKVMVQKDAGLGSGITNEEFTVQGANILGSAAEVWENAEMIIKVKEPLSEEYGYFREDLVLFTYLHLAAEGELTKALAEKKVTAIAYETIQLDDGSLPLLTPMSEVAGRMSVQVGAQLLEKPKGGRGVLLGGIPGVPPADVVIIGGGVVGTNAAKMAHGLGASVTIVDLNPNRLRQLDDLFGGNVNTLMSNSVNVQKAVSFADLLIGAVLIPGAKAPHIVTDDMVRGMKKAAVIVDVAIDQGGCIQTIDHVTTHSEPTYEKYGVLHYAVANIPGAVARTSTFGLTNSTLPYALQLANKGWLRAVKENEPLSNGVNVVKGKVTYRAVAEAHGMEYVDLETLI